MTTRFDTLSKSVATRLSRRTALRTTSAGIAAGLVSTIGRTTTAQDATPATPTAEGNDPTFLFVQTATSGTFSPNPGAGTPAVDGTPTPGGGADYLLTLDGHHGGTVYFSDRPERIFGDAPTPQFLDGLGFSPTNPPNAALVTHTEDGTEDVVVLELTDPSYDEGSGTLSYGATILAEYQGEGLAHVAAPQQDAALPENFGRASLFIDDCPDMGVACTIGNSCMGDFKAGTCWDWSAVDCTPCRSQLSYTDECNDTFAESCNGDCTALVNSHCG